MTTAGGSRMMASVLIKVEGVSPATRSCTASSSRAAPSDDVSSSSLTAQGVPR